MEEHRARSTDRVYRDTDRESQGYQKVTEDYGGVQDNQIQRVDNRTENRTIRDIPDITERTYNE